MFTVKTEFHLSSKNKKEKKSEEKKNKEKVLSDQVELKSNKMITIWNLPKDITEEKIKYMCRSIKKIQVDKIKRSNNKALMIVSSDFLKKQGHLDHY